MVLWFADWPVIAACALASDEIEDAPVALIAQNRVFACSASARAVGVRARLRLREAQALCPELVALPYDPEADSRAFEPVLVAIEQVVAGVQPIRPGCCAVALRGAVRYYGGEREAAAAIVAQLRDRSVLGADAVRVAIADDTFTAELAVRVSGGSSGVATTTATAAAHAATPVVVPAGGSREFLAPLPVEALGEPDTVSLLHRLGVKTLGQFAALPPASVEGRMGVEGSRLQQLASGRDPRRPVPRERAHDYAVRRSFDDPVDRVDQLAFTLRADAEQMITALGRARLVCTGLRVEFDTENGERSSRLWLHPRFFTAADVIDRVRWQRERETGDTQRRPTHPDAELFDTGNSDHDWGGGVTSVALIPEQLDEVLHHEPGFFGEPDTERVHQVLSRIQGMVGHEGVLTAQVVGGRSPAERQRFVAWGDAPTAAVADGPWPGQIPPPAPATVFEKRMPIRVYDSGGVDVSVDERGVCGDGPELMQGVATRRIVAWTGPWSVASRWWDTPPTPRRDRFQVIDETGTAWLLVYEAPVLPDAAGDSAAESPMQPAAQGTWWLEARYD